jgi:hypothetical protein
VSGARSIFREKEKPMRYQYLSQPYHTSQRGFGFRDMLIIVLLLQRQTMLSLIELNIFSFE